jgi:membrane protein
MVERASYYLRLTSAAAWHALKRFYSGHDLTYAASIAYWALLSLFPFLLLIMSLVGAAIADDADRTAVVQFALDYFPARVEFITRQLDAFRQTPLQLGIAGVAGLTWASLGFFGSVSTAVNYAWGVETPRSFLKHRVFAFLMLVTAGVMFAIAMVMVSAVPIIEASWFAQVLPRFPALMVLQSLAARWISTVLLIIVLGFIYYFVPNAKVRFRHVWLGAILTGFVWRAAFAGFSWYIGDVSELSRIHGSIAAVVIFLFWIYVSAVILLYGVQFTAAYGRLRSGHRLEAAVKDAE